MTIQTAYNVHEYGMWYDNMFYSDSKKNYKYCLKAENGKTFYFYSDLGQ